MEKQLIYFDLLLKVRILNDKIDQLQNKYCRFQTQYNENILTKEEIIRYDIDMFKLQNIKLYTALYKNSKIIFVIQIPN